MDSAPVGILEFKNDRFIGDIVSQLSNVPIEFMSLSNERIPTERNYRVVVDRLSFCNPFLKEIMKNLALNGTYIINNPFAASATNKLVEISLGSRLGLNFPKTIVLPDQKAMSETGSPVSQPNLHKVAEELGFPCIFKPFDGYAWEDVYVARSLEELQNLYVALSPRRVMMAQQLIKFRDYLRVFCIDKKEVLFIRWIPKPLSMGQYLPCDLNSIGGAADRLTALTIELNRVLDLDVNVTEWCVDEEGRWWVIDAFNEVPEVIPEALPPEYYSWIVNKFAACIRGKLESNLRNRTAFNI